MATLYEYYSSGDDTKVEMSTIRWAAQTFTPSTSHSLEYVRLKLYREAGAAGTLTVEIQTTSVNKPTNTKVDVSATSTLNFSSLTTSTSGDWYTIYISSEPLLSAGTTYAIVVKSSSVNTNTHWRVDNSSPTYSNGRFCQTLNSGVNWYG